MALARTLFSAVVGIACALPQMQEAAAQPVQEYELKAAYVYNFAQLTEWPSAVLGSPDAPFAICILGRGVPAPGFEGLSGKRVHGRRIELRALAAMESAPRCHVLYVGGPEHVRLRQIVAALGDAPVLTVADGEAPGTGGAVITLFPRESRILFHVDLTAASHAQLRISSRLLRLAARVTGAEGPR